MFDRLLLWRDLNHNGFSEPDELRRASHIGLLSISTDYKENRRRDRYGNEFRQRAPVVWNVDSTLVKDHLYDVWLRSKK